MYCKNHSGKPGVNTCSKCGEWICEDCSVEINGRIFCKECLSKEMSGESKGFSASAPTGPVPARRAISSFFTFVFSLFPGCGYMYLGFMKRGLMIMALFFASIYLSCFSSAFGMVTFLIYAFNFFDTFHYKRRLLNGEYINDDIEDIKSFALNNKGIIGISVILVVAIEFLSRISYSFFGFRHYGGFTNGLVILLVIVGVIFIFKKKDKNQ